VLRVLPDEEYDVHHRLEEAVKVGKVTFRLQLVEPVLKGAQVLGVVISLETCNENFLAERRERGAVRALVLLKDTQSLSDTSALKLLEDGVEVGSLVLPKFDLDLGCGVEAALKWGLGVKLEDVLDLLSPCDNGSLKKRDDILFLCCALEDLGRGERQTCLTLSLADSNAHIRDEAMETLTELLGHHIAPTFLYVGVTQKRKVDLIQQEFDVFNDSSGNLGYRALLPRFFAQRARLMLNKNNRLPLARHSVKCVGNRQSITTNHHASACIVITITPLFDLRPVSEGKA
jgi:hypothetical protein